jgi:hypothetical protein
MVLSSGVLLALLGTSGVAGETPTAFVQRFYNSYLKQEAPNWAETVRKRRSLFDPTLASALRDDAAAQARTTGYIVGIDFDPFLGSQDPVNRFAAGRAIPTPVGYRVEVYDLESGAKPTVLVDVAPSGGSWIITDFRYPTTSSELLSILRLLRRSRAPSH